MFVHICSSNVNKDSQMNGRDTHTTTAGRAATGVKASAILFLASIVLAPIVRSHAVTAVCSIEPSSAPQQLVINPFADTDVLSKAPDITVIDHYAEALGYSKTIRRIEIANQDNEVGITIYMPDICAE
jgi:hypothetical protein